MSKPHITLKSTNNRLYQLIKKHGFEKGRDMFLFEMLVKL